MALSLFIAAVGLWDKAMITIYLCGIAVLAACLIGDADRDRGGQRDRLWRVVQAVIDTLQTLPSFVYLMPVVMLFRVGDFSAIIAVIAYAVAPAIRYTAHGIRQVDPQLIEAGIVSGCTPFQLLTKVKLKLAFPEIMLGLNQTIMLSLSMLVITALVGTRDLGQEALIALTRPRPATASSPGCASPSSPLSQTGSSARAPSACAPGSGCNRERRSRMSDAAEKVKSLSIWKGEVDPQPVSGGLSNVNFCVEDGGAKYFVRICEDSPYHHVFREPRPGSAGRPEAGISPALVHYETGAMVFEFKDARTYDGDDVIANIDRLVPLVKRCHREVPKHIRGPAPCSGCSTSCATTPMSCATATAAAWRP